MKRLLVLITVMIVLVGAPALNAAGQQKTYYDMVEGRYYDSSNFYPVEGYAFGRLTNHDDAYGDYYNGDGEVILEKVTNGVNACTSSAVNVKPTESIQCSKNGLSNSTQYQTKAIWDVVHGAGGSIWSAVE